MAQTPVSIRRAINRLSTSMSRTSLHQTPDSLAKDLATLRLQTVEEKWALTESDITSFRARLATAHRQWSSMQKLYLAIPQEIRDHRSIAAHRATCNFAFCLPPTDLPREAPSAGLASLLMLIDSRIRQVEITYKGRFYKREERGLYARGSLALGYMEEVERELMRLMGALEGHGELLGEWAMRVGMEELTVRAEDLPEEVQEGMERLSVREEGGI